MSLKKIILLILASLLVVFVVFFVVFYKNRKFTSDLSSIKAHQGLKSEFENTSQILLKYAAILEEYQQAQLMKNYKNQHIPAEKLATKTKEYKEKDSNLFFTVIEIKYNLKKISLNIKNDLGQTPLMLNLKIAPIVYGIDKNRAKNFVNAQDNNGKTVIQYLIDSSYVNDIGSYVALLMHGAKVTDNDIEAVKSKLKNDIYLNPITGLLEKWQTINK